MLQPYLSGCSQNSNALRSGGNNNSHTHRQHHVEDGHVIPHTHTHMQQMAAWQKCLCLHKHVSGPVGNRSLCWGGAVLGNCCLHTATGTQCNRLLLVLQHTCGCTGSHCCVGTPSSAEIERAGQAHGIAQTPPTDWGGGGRGAKFSWWCRVDGTNYKLILRSTSESHRAHFRTQQSLVGIRVAALCHISRVCVWAAASCVLLLPFAGLHLGVRQGHAGVQTHGQSDDAMSAAARSFVFVACVCLLSGLWQGVDGGGGRGGWIAVTLTNDTAERLRY